MQACFASVFGILVRYRVPILLLLCVASGSYFLKGYLSFDSLRAHRVILVEFRDANYLLAVLAFILAYTLFVAFSVPGGLILSLAGGFLFATFPGVLYNMGGANLAAKLENSEGLVKKIKDGIDANQWSMLFLIRLIPGVPFFLANLVPSFLDVPLQRFAISTFFGIFPGALVFTSIGAGLGDIFARGQTPDLAVVWEPQIILPILGLCLLSALPVLLKILRGKKGI
jgi:uncharacterized membrane protein YdjX (TVP38/TMEM64 family)